MAPASVQAVVGIVPLVVFTRCREVVGANIDPPTGPRWEPTTASRNQGIASGVTKAGSLDSAIFFAHTALVSSELCHVARWCAGFRGIGAEKVRRDLLANIAVDPFESDETGSLAALGISSEAAGGGQANVVLRAHGGAL